MEAVLWQRNSGKWNTFGELGFHPGYKSKHLSCCESSDGIFNRTLVFISHFTSVHFPSLFHDPSFVAQRNIWQTIFLFFFCGGGGSFIPNLVEARRIDI